MRSTTGIYQHCHSYSAIFSESWKRRIWVERVKKKTLYASHSARFQICMHVHFRDLLTWFEGDQNTVTTSTRKKNPKSKLTQFMWQTGVEMKRSPRFSNAIWNPASSKPLLPSSTSKLLLFSKKKKKIMKKMCVFHTVFKRNGRTFTDEQSFLCFLKHPTVNTSFKQVFQKL